MTGPKYILRLSHKVVRKPLRTVGPETTKSDEWRQPMKLKIGIHGAWQSVASSVRASKQRLWDTTSLIRSGGDTQSIISSRFVGVPSLNKSCKGGFRNGKMDKSHIRERVG